MKVQVLDTINIFEMWEKLDFNYSKPEQLNKKEAVFVRVKNHAYDKNWALPEFIHGWVYLEGWFDNKVAGEKGRRGATRLQWRPDMGLPILLDGYHNDNNGASLWFVPQVAIGGDSPWQIRFEIEYAKRGQPALARLFAEKKN